MFFRNDELLHWALMYLLMVTVFKLLMHKHLGLRKSANDL